MALGTPGFKRVCKFEGCKSSGFSFFTCANVFTCAERVPVFVKLDGSGRCEPGCLPIVLEALSPTTFLISLPAMFVE